MVREKMEITTVGDEKLRYPRSIAFIISNEFCERFNYYGMRTILVLYLTRQLNYDDDFATVLFHIFTMFVYFFPIFGAIIADSWLGKFKTIVYLSIIYAIGSTVIAVGAIPVVPISAQASAVIGLFLIAIGTGGIKPCVSAFGGDQFRLPEQAKQLATFFSLFYFAINAGSLISTSLTPILREDVHCFGDQHCYSLAFGVPGALMIASIVIFICGRPLYTVKQPGGNMILEVSKCIGHALKMRMKDHKVQNKSHWLDYAESKYGKQLVSDIKALFAVLVIFLPLPVFWALFDQQGSRWTFQATRMTGELGAYTIKPDQMQVVNPLLILAFIPIFTTCLYPVLAKCGINTPLRKLGMGGVLAGVAFIVSAIVEIELEKSYPVLPKNHEGQLRIYNSMDCEYMIHSNITGHPNFTLKPLEVFEDKHLEVLGDSNVFHLDLNSTGSHCPFLPASISIENKKAISYFLKGNTFNFTLQRIEEDPNKSKNGSPIIRVFTNIQTKPAHIQLEHIESGDVSWINSTAQFSVVAGKYHLWVNSANVLTADVELGGSYLFVISEKIKGGFDAKEYVIAPPNSLHMLWLLPQYIIMTAAEVMFSVTGLEFSFTQAPESMKAVLTAAWLLTVAVGNLIVAIIAETKAFDSQAHEFFLFAALMFVDMGIFIYLAVRYTYVDIRTSEPAPPPAVATQPSDAESGMKTIDLRRDPEGVDNNGYKPDDEEK